jgi:hypothetical protein
MAGTRNNDQQSRDRWRLNGRKRSETDTVGFASPNGAKRSESTPVNGATSLVEASTYVDYAGGRYAPETSTPGPTDNGRIYAAMPPVDPYTGPVDPYAEPEYDDTVLGGLHYRTAAPRQPVGDIEWAGALRRFARAMVWCLPAAVLALALASVWGWPTSTAEPSGASPGTWLVMTLLGLGLWLAGVIGLAALVASTALRMWGTVAALATIAGTVLAAPALGVIGLARPAVSRAAYEIGADPAGEIQGHLLDGSVGRWLVIGGFVLLAVGAIAAAGAILGSRVLSRIDGWLVVGAIAVAAIGAYLSWEFLLTLAAMVMLAATLGLAWTVSRLGAEGDLTGVD